MPYLTGALIALGFVAVSLLCYFAGRRPQRRPLFAIVMIVVLVAYKSVALPGSVTARRVPWWPRT